MAGFYQTFTSSRTTEPDPIQLLNQLRALDSTAGVQHFPGDLTYTIKKSTDWLPAHVTAAQNVIDTAPATSPQLTAQNWVDKMPIEEKSIYLTAIDETNRLRQWLMDFKAAVAAATSLADLKTRVAALNDLQQVTPQQAIQAAKNKAGTL